MGGCAAESVKESTTTSSTCMSSLATPGPESLAVADMLQIGLLSLPRCRFKMLTVGCLELDASNSTSQADIASPKAICMATNGNICAPLITSATFQTPLKRSGLNRQGQVSIFFRKSDIGPRIQSFFTVCNRLTIQHRKGTIRRMNDGEVEKRTAVCPVLEIGYQQATLTDLENNSDNSHLNRSKLSQLASRTESAVTRNRENRCQRRSPTETKRRALQGLEPRLSA